MTLDLSRLEQLESHFAEALEREKLASLKQLAYGASHEINNPLAAISANAQALLRDEANLDRRRRLSAIHLQAMRAHEMIADLMYFASPPRPNLAPVALGPIVDQAIQELAKMASEQKTTLVREKSLFDASSPAESSEVVALVDRSHLLIALKAIVQNSLEALRAGGSVTIGLSMLDDIRSIKFAEISIRDSGPGIDAEMRRHLFDPFYSGREAGRGLGFGMAKAWRIVELHQGEIFVESEPGQGTTVRVRLPT